MNNKFFNKNTVKIIEKHTIAYLGPGNLVGEDVIQDEAHNPLGVYHSNVKCISKEASLLYIMKEDFMKLQQQASTWR